MMRSALWLRRVSAAVFILISLLSGSSPVVTGLLESGELPELRKALGLQEGQKFERGGIYRFTVD